MKETRCIMRPQRETGSLENNPTWDANIWRILPSGVSTVYCSLKALAFYIRVTVGNGVSLGRPRSPPCLVKGRRWMDDRI